MNRPSMRQRVTEATSRWQTALVSELEALDGSVRARSDAWQRPGGGGGLSCVLEQGAVFDKAGVNTALVEGQLSGAAARSMAGSARLDGAEPYPFVAAGLSIVIHPRNPFAPTAHANFRYVELGGSWWFGGGMDLTPAYLFEDDARHFHGTLREVCERFDPEYYPRFSRQCDAYFWLPHRQEARGLGGIFFDDLHGDAEALWAFVSACAQAFAPAYLPIVARRKDTPFDDTHVRWQQLRRGRYVEFNLLHDRGTAFGLQSGGRVESILMSLPLVARWEYAPPGPASGSPEAELLAVLQKPRRWA